MNISFKLLSGVAVLALAACSSVPLPNANLEDARNSVNQAAANPHVSRLAQSELARAREALNRADNISGHVRLASTVEPAPCVSESPSATTTPTGSLDNTSTADR